MHKKVDDAPDIDVVMSMYNLIEYSDNCSKTSEIWCHFYRDLLTLDNNNAILDFNADNPTTRPFNIKTKLIGKTGANTTKNVKIIIPLKYQSNFWRTFINCEMILDLKLV